jgi:hypothetical protein
MSKINKATKKFAQKKQKGQAQFKKKHTYARKPSAGEWLQCQALLSQQRACLIAAVQFTCSMRAINQLHVFLAREEPKKGATPKPPLVVPNR